MGGYLKEEVKREGGTIQGRKDKGGYEWRERKGGDIREGRKCVKEERKDGVCRREGRKIRERRKEEKKEEGKIK